MRLADGKECVLARQIAPARSANPSFTFHSNSDDGDRGVQCDYLGGVDPWAKDDRCVWRRESKRRRIADSRSDFPRWRN